jgi:hypothetical protein
MATTQRNGERRTANERRYSRNSPRGEAEDRKSVRENRGDLACRVLWNEDSFPGYGMPLSPPNYPGSYLRTPNRIVYFACFVSFAYYLVLSPFGVALGNLNYTVWPLWLRYS